MPKKLCIYLLTAAIGLTCRYLFAAEEIEVPISEPIVTEIEQSSKDFETSLLEDSFEPNCTTGEGCTHAEQ